MSAPGAQQAFSDCSRKVSDAPLADITSRSPPQHLDPKGDPGRRRAGQGRTWLGMPTRRRLQRLLRATNSEPDEIVAKYAWQSSSYSVIPGSAPQVSRERA